ncbi:MAG TPA: MFS transporter [Thermotogota bacterium]|nr:MFS transporter [Thermotogota bacterium]HPJ90110.1 MFS transporter [Thermotogota bacterium]HPR96010.1 MFS transporter [Thermotogota bacterium]
MEEKILRRAMINSIIEGSGASVFLIMIQGFVFTKVAIEFGVNEFLLGFLMGIQLLSQVFQIFVPRIINRVGKRKPIVIIFSFLTRSLWLLLVIFPIFGLITKQLFISVVALSFIFGAFSGNAWTSWMRDLIPEKKMGTFFGTRNFINTAVSLTFILIFSRILEHNPNMKGVQIVVLIGSIVSLLSIFFLWKQHEPPLKDMETGNLFKFIISNKNNVRLLIFGGFWNFANLFASAFFSFHQIQNLHMSFSLLGILSMSFNLVMIGCAFFWGKIADKIGHKNVLRIGVVLASILATVWFFMTPQTVSVLMWVDISLGGIAWSAINLSIFTLPLIVGGSSAGILYGYFAAVNGIFGFIGSLFGGTAANYLSNVNFSFFSLEMNGLQFIFLSTGIMRFLSLFLLNRVEVKGHVRLKQAFGRQFAGFNRRRGSSDLFEPIPLFSYMNSMLLDSRATDIKDQREVL